MEFGGTGNEDVDAFQLFNLERAREGDLSILAISGHSLDTCIHRLLRNKIYAVQSTDVEPSALLRTPGLKTNAGGYCADSFGNRENCLRTSVRLKLNTLQVGS